MYNNEDPFYCIWNQKNVLGDCLRLLGYKILASELNKYQLSSNIIDEYTKLIQELARHSKDQSVLEMLYFSCLVYG